MRGGGVDFRLRVQGASACRIQVVGSGCPSVSGVPPPERGTERARTGPADVGSCPVGDRYIDMYRERERERERERKREI